MDIKINYVRDLCHTISVQIQYVTVGVSVFNEGWCVFMQYTSNIFDCKQFFRAGQNKPFETCDRNYQLNVSWNQSFYLFQYYVLSILFWNF